MRPSTVWMSLGSRRAAERANVILRCAPFGIRSRRQPPICPFRTACAELTFAVAAAADQREQKEKALSFAHAGISCRAQTPRSTARPFPRQDQGRRFIFNERD
jgi:hypothetical protein